MTAFNLSIDVNVIRRSRPTCNINHQLRRAHRMQCSRTEALKMQDWKTRDRKMQDLVCYAHRIAHATSCFRRSPDFNFRYFQQITCQLST